MSAAGCKVRPMDRGVEAWRATRRQIEQRLCLVMVGAGLLGLTIICPPAPRLVWNASASVPVGLYLIHPGAPPIKQGFILAALPEPWRGFAARRQYLSENVPLLKRVAAIHGDLVCAFGPIITIDGAMVARRLRKDARGRMLPWWEGCHHLRGGELFLLARDQTGSFDGRYFGVTHRNTLIGTAQLLWSK